MNTSTSTVNGRAEPESAQRTYKFGFGPRILRFDEKLDNQGWWEERGLTWTDEKRRPSRIDKNGKEERFVNFGKFFVIDDVLVFGSGGNNCPETLSQEQIDELYRATPEWDKTKTYEWAGEIFDCATGELLPPEKDFDQ